jgi:CheY-like chemotaxis protein
MIPPDHTLRILLVEDHVATASALAKALLKYGFAVAPANSARAALEAARLQPFDLLITDIGLPQKNGWELFRELRRLQPHLVAIAVTGYAYPQDVQRSKDVGIEVHLNKPATIQQVLAAISRLFPTPGPGSDRSLRGTPWPVSSTGKAGPATLRLLYLEDDARDVELLQLACQENEPDCELTAAGSRDEFIASLRNGRVDGILSDSGVHDLPGAEAVGVARSLAPRVPYVFLCGVMDPAKRADLLAAMPDGIFSKDRPGDAGLAIGLLRELSSRNR